MNERFELSFKNKEVRMWFYIIVPTFIMGSLILFFASRSYNYVPWIMLIIAWITFYTWRFLYSRKQKKNNPS